MRFHFQLSVALLALLSLKQSVAGQDTNMAAWELGPFVRPDSVNPVIAPDTNSVFNCPMVDGPVRWEALHTFNPAAVVRQNHIFVFYRAEDASGTMKIGGHTSRIGLAESGDGLHFNRRPSPVLFPDDDDQKTNEWTGGCEDPRVVEAEDGTYVMAYTEYRRNDTERIARLGIATSEDLVHWQKQGPAFGKLGGRFANHGCKSGAIVTSMVDGRLKAAKWQEKYWMYWGEGEIRLATSTDLINWLPGPVVLKTRPGNFDSDLVEAGPPAIMTDHGILLIYNAKNSSSHGDATLPAGLYSGGQALFDPQNPAHLLRRCDGPFYKPQAAFEQTGQYKAGTTFLEGLVSFDKKWFLYYGCADSFVAVAVIGNKSTNQATAQKLFGGPTKAMFPSDMTPMIIRNNLN